jgi:tetratricopeptide (TPR) repeat protein
MLKEAVLMDPEIPEAYSGLALLEIRDQKPDLAMDYIEYALSLAPDNPYFLNNRGYIHLTIGNYESALGDINASIEIDPYNSWSYRNKGIYYYKTEKYEDALRLLNKAKEMDINLESIDLYLGLTHIELGNTDKACEYFNNGLSAGDEQCKEAMENFCLK